MVANITLCVLSTLCFCFCLRGMLITARSAAVPLITQRLGYSARAWRFARIYVSAAFAVLAGLALVGTISSYLELFG